MLTEGILDVLRKQLKLVWHSLDNILLILLFSFFISHSVFWQRLLLKIDDIGMFY